MTFDESYWAFEERIRHYHLESVRNYYSEVFNDIEEIGIHGKHPLLLDMGCGYGYFMQICAEKDYECLGIDISKYALSKFSNKPAKVILCDVQSGLPLKSKSVNVAIMLDVLEHLNKPNASVKEIKRILKPNGLLYISTPNLAALMRLVKRRTWYGFLDKTHISLFTPFQLTKLVKQCGFNILKCYTPFHFFTFRNFMPKIFGHCYIGGQIRLIAQNE